MGPCSWRTLQLPPVDRAFWRPTGAEHGPLLYLAWGARHYGSAPIATTLHEGWVYAVVEHGSPLLVRADSKDRITAPALLVIGPDCASGWADDPGRLSRLLVWIWRQPQHPVLARLNPAGLVHVALSAGELGLLDDLHRLTRGEIHLADAHSPPALAGLQSVIEAHVARVLDCKPDAGESKTVSRAVQWLEQHLDSHQPLARLADYLALSPSSVQRLFRLQFGRSVTQVMAEMRRREAARMITVDGAPIKAVAYRLGYRHPYDFSRAFRKQTGSSPSRLGGRLGEKR